MKNLILITFLVVGLFAKAQQSELIENTWYLEKLVIDDEEFFPPNNEEVSEVVAEFVLANENNGGFRTYVCNGLEGDIIYNNEDDSFIAPFGWSPPFDECIEQENQLFENRYVYEFLEFNFSEITGPFHYEIVSGDNAMQLIVTNSMGSKAYYNNAPLSISEVNLVANHFQIAFHHEDLVVKSSQSVAESVLIFDLNGRLVQESKVENEKISTVNLPKGIYVVKIIDKNGKTYTQKIRK